MLLKTVLLYTKPLCCCEQYIRRGVKAGGSRDNHSREKEKEEEEKCLLLSKTVSVLGFKI